MKLEGKTFAVLVEDHYEDLELWYPLLRLKEEGASVVLVGPEKGRTYKSKHGYAATADQGSSDIAVEDLAGIVIPGGYAPDRMRRDERMIQLVRAADQANKLVAAICHAGWVLASADIVRGRTVTGFFSIRDDLINAGAKWVDQEVVRDGNLITSRQPADLPAFARTMIEAST